MCSYEVVLIIWEQMEPSPPTTDPQTGKDDTAEPESPQKTKSKSVTFGESALPTWRGHQDRTRSVDPNRSRTGLTAPGLPPIPSDAALGDREMRVPPLPPARKPDSEDKPKGSKSMQGPAPLA